MSAIASWMKNPQILAYFESTLFVYPDCMTKKDDVSLWFVFMQKDTF